MPTLLPYQKRTVRWLLSREGKRLDGRALKDCARPGDESFGWEELRLPLRVAPPLGIIVDEETSTKEEEQGESIWFNRVSGLIVKREADVKSVSEDWSLALVKGGMLCEEMGSPFLPLVFGRGWLSIDRLNLSDGMGMLRFGQDAGSHCVDSTEPKNERDQDEF